jgi:hypothetical protein
MWDVVGKRTKGTRRLRGCEWSFLNLTIFNYVSTMVTAIIYLHHRFPFYILGYIVDSTSRQPAEHTLTSSLHPTIHHPMTRRPDISSPVGGWGILNAQNRSSNQLRHPTKICDL